MFQCPCGLWGLFYLGEPYPTADVPVLVSVPVWALGSFLQALSPCVSVVHSCTRFSARVGSGVFSTGPAASTSPWRRPPGSTGFSARVGSGVFSTWREEAVEHQGEPYKCFSARVGSGVFSTGDQPGSLIITGD